MDRKLWIAVIAAAVVLLALVLWVLDPLDRSKEEEQPKVNVDASGEIQQEDTNQQEQTEDEEKAPWV